MTKNNGNIENIFNRVITFFESYDNKKIDTCESHRNDLNSMKSTIENYIKKHANVKIQNKNYLSKWEKFFVIKVNDVITTNLLLCYSIFYFIDNICSDKKLFIGLDFEFNRSKIALCQAGFYPNKKHKYIFVFDPNLVNSEQTNIIIRTIFTSNIYRITHGADSLDIPYIFNELFVGDHDKIISFTKTLLDTRFLCEYFKGFINYEDKKCSIYDALLFFDVIKKEKYDDLNKINEIMGPVQDVNWNVNKMSSYHLKYAVYDVLYLKSFVKKVFMIARTRNMELYEQLKLVPIIDRFNCYEKFGILNILKETKDITDPLNNYIVELDDWLNAKSTSTMIQMFNETIEKNKHILNLLKINNFKKPMTLLFKRIYYSMLTHKYKIFVNKKEQFIKKITHEDILIDMKKMELGKLTTLLEKFYKSI